MTLQIIRIAIFQFCAVKFFGSLAKCVTQGLDVYCAEVRSARYSRTYVRIPGVTLDTVSNAVKQIFAIEIVSLITAMLMLLQFYRHIEGVIGQHQPLFKFIAIKLVVAVFYLQNVSQTLYRPQETSKWKLIRAYKSSSSVNSPPRAEGLNQADRFRTLL